MLLLPHTSFIRFKSESTCKTEGGQDHRIIGQCSAGQWVLLAGTVLVSELSEDATQGAGEEVGGREGGQRGSHLG